MLSLSHVNSPRPTIHSGYVQFSWWLIALWGFVLVADNHAASLKVGTFEVDVTPPLGTPVAYARSKY